MYLNRCPPLPGTVPRHDNKNRCKKQSKAKNKLCIKEYIFYRRHAMWDDTGVLHMWWDLVRKDMTMLGRMWEKRSVKEMMNWYNSNFFRISKTPFYIQRLSLIEIKCSYHFFGQFTPISAHVAYHRFFYPVKVGGKSGVVLHSKFELRGGNLEKKTRK